MLSDQGPRQAYLSQFVRHIRDRHELAAVRERDPGVTHSDVVFALFVVICFFGQSRQASGGSSSHFGLRSHGRFHVGLSVGPPRPHGSHATAPARREFDRDVKSAGSNVTLMCSRSSGLEVHLPALPRANASSTHDPCRGASCPRYWCSIAEVVAKSKRASEAAAASADSQFGMGPRQLLKLRKLLNAST